MGTSYSNVGDDKSEQSKETSGGAETEISEGHAKYVLFILFVLYIFNFVDRQILNILLTPIKKELGISDTMLGSLAGIAFAVTYAGFGILFARLADRYNRTTIITLGLAAWSGFTAISGCVRSYWQLFAARVGVGIGEATASPAAHSLISDYFPPEKRSRALAIYSMGANIGMLVGMIVGGVVAQHFGWRYAFFVVGLPGILLAVVIRTTVKEPVRGLADNLVGQFRTLPLGDVFKYMFSKKSFVFLCLSASLYAIAGAGFFTWAPTFLVRTHGMDLQETGIIMGLNMGFVGAIGTFMGGLIADKLGKKDIRWTMWICSISAVAMLPFLALFLLIPNKTLAIASFTPCILVSMMYTGPTFATVQAVAKLNMRAMAAAILLFFINLLGFGVGPFFIGLVSDLLAGVAGDDSLRYSMLAINIFSVAAAVCYLFAAKTLRKDIEDAKAL